MTCLASRTLHLALCLSLTATLYGCAVSATGRTWAVSGCLLGAARVSRPYLSGGLECVR